MVDDKDITRLKEIFVTRKECQETSGTIESKMAESSTKIAVIATEVKQIKWLCVTVLAGIVANLIGAVFNMIGV